MTDAAQWQKGGQLPVAGIFVPTPVFGTTPLSINLFDQFANVTDIRITVEVTADQAEDPLFDDGILYCCGADPFLDFPVGYQFDNLFMVPDVIGVGFSVNEKFNPAFPYLYIGSRNDRPSEVRIRAI
jgi:hypothetical protein